MNLRAILFLSTLFICLIAKGQIIADFRADVTQGCAPLVVQFTDLSSAASAEWFWDFGNGNTSRQQNPGTIYFASGNYNVKLVVKNANGTDSTVKNKYISVFPKPDVKFAASDTAGCAPLIVKFADQSNGISGPIATWQWDFGDGNSSSQPSPVHTYNRDGVFTVILKVVNSSGCVQVLTKQSLIHVQKLIPDFTTGTVISCKPPVQINFFGNSTGGSITSSLWNFGDGSTSTDPNPSHTYIREGTYNVKLVVTNEFGCTDSVIKPAVIGSVTPAFTAPDTVCSGAAANFINTSSPAIVSAAWMFGDGTSSTDINPVKVFDTSGRFTVKLVNNFGACIDSTAKSIFVLPKPLANFSFTGSSTGCSLPLNINFTGNFANAISQLWYFGDGSTSADVNPKHVYSNYGYYSVSVKVTNANGCSDSIAKPGLISITPVAINKFNGLPYAGCLPHSHTFSADISSPEPVSGYLWSFGDSATSTLQNPVHTYAKRGNYTVSLIVTTVNGCTDTFNLPSAITVTPKPVANFSASPLISCSHDPVNFTNQSSAGVNNWFWKFGDGNTSKQSDPLHHYSDTGFFSVTLIAGDYSCYDTITRRQYVYINPPVANFSVLYNCDSPYARRFINRSVASLINSWDFGDQSSSDEVSPFHKYAAPGSYKVVLKVVNNNCVDTFINTIQVIDEHPVLTVPKNIICKNGPVNFTAANINASNILSYTWDFGDGSPALNSNQPTISHTYSTPANYTASLTIKDKLGCSRKANDSLSITIYGPKANFSNPAGTCKNDSIVFKDSSTAYSTYAIKLWVMNYGDGKTDSSGTAAFTHAYTSKGAYNVSLTVTDTSGCKDVLTKPAAIIITDPKALFLVSDSLSCTRSQINFTNLSNGLGLRSLWLFGDSSRSADANPVHRYAAEGLYNISLTITDTFGCINSYKKPSVIVKDPKAFFALSDSVITCPPASIRFFNHSVNTTSFTWDFDDGSFSTIDSPSHFFLTARIYNVKLISRGYGGCSDTLVRTVLAKGPSGSFTYSPLVKCAPATINFSGIVQNNSKTFVWDFGDGTTTTTTASSVSHQYIIPGRYLPKLLLHDTGFVCSVSIFGADTITAFGVKSFVQSINNVFCDTANITFLDSSIVRYDTISSYLWTFGDGITSGVKNPNHTYQSPGIFPVRLTITTNGGCKDSSQNVFVKIVNGPKLQLTGATSTCLNQSVAFAATVAQDTSAISWNWDFGNGKTYHIQAPPAQTYAVPGNYPVKVAVSNSSGCAANIIKVLAVHPLPAVNAGTDTVICFGQSLTLNASGAQTYNWATSASLSCTTCSNPVATPNSTTNYFVTGIDTNSCEKTDSLQVKVVAPVTITSITADTLCAGQSLQLFVAGADTYSWSPSTGLNNTNTGNPVAAPLTSTVYSVIGSDRYGCFSDTAYVPLTVYPIPVFNIEKDHITLPVGNSVTLNTTSSADIIKWRWFPATGLSCNNCPQPVATPANDIVYKAIATNGGGCMAEDRITIQVFCNNGNIYIPNTFSPNNDGNNDVFFPRGKGIAEVKNLQVFNRWGAVVFQRSHFGVNQMQAGWDGTYHGQLLDADVYVYQMEVVCETGQVFSFKGDITLIR